jgi:hypothetical protein
MSADASSAPETGLVTLYLKDSCIDPSPIRATNAQYDDVIVTTQRGRTCRTKFRGRKRDSTPRWKKGDWIGRVALIGGELSTIGRITEVTRFKVHVQWLYRTTYESEIKRVVYQLMTPQALAARDLYEVVVLDQQQQHTLAQLQQHADGAAAYGGILDFRGQLRHLQLASLQTTGLDYAQPHNNNTV